MKVWMLCLAMLPLALGGGIDQMVMDGNLDGMMEAMVKHYGVEPEHHEEHHMDSYEFDHLYEKFVKKASKEELKAFEFFVHHGRSRDSMMDDHDDHDEETMKNLKAYLKQRWHDTTAYLEAYTEGFKYGVVEEVLKMCQCDNDGLELLRRIDDEAFGMIEMGDGNTNCTGNGTCVVKPIRKPNSNSTGVDMGEDNGLSVMDDAKWFYENKDDPVEQFKYALKGSYHVICTAIRKYIDYLGDLEQGVAEFKMNATDVKGPAEP